MCGGENNSTHVTMEQVFRGRSHSVGLKDSLHPNALHGYVSQRYREFDASVGKDALNGSTEDLCKSFDPDTIGNDLMYRCQKFYLNHQKSLDGLKQAYVSTALDKKEARTRSRMELAMDRLSSEMVIYGDCHNVPNIALKHY